MARVWVVLLVRSAVGLPILSSELIARTPEAPETGIGYGVDSTGDGDNVGSSQFCDDGTGHCTLRAAIQAANSHPGVDFIGIGLPAGSVINLTHALPDISEAVSISGPGVGQLTVRRDTGGVYRIFTVTAATGVVSLSGITISNGLDLFSGGGILNQGDGTLNISNCILSSNTAFNDGHPTRGGALDNFSNGTVNVTNSYFSGNYAVSGGAIYNGEHFNDTGTVNVTNSTLSDNTGGGAIFNGEVSSMNITSSTVSGNEGGVAGIYNEFGAMNVTNSTLSGNAGGGIFNNAGTVNVTNSTLSGNSGSGITNNAGTVNVKSSIIALNTGGTGCPDVCGSFATQGFNLIGKMDGSTGFTALTDQKGTIAAPLDPKLDPGGLQNNGGSTETIALLFDSPAIDKGTSNGLAGQLTTDQRGSGYPRTFDDPGIENALGGDDTDIGAFELQMAAPTLLANISTRLRVETGDNVLIGGFIITGTQPKRVIVRAIGPSLLLAGTLANPILELRDSFGGLTASNDNWRSDREAEIIATGIPPTDDLEAAIVATLPANNSAYTAIVSGVNNGTGIGLVEAYDLDRTVDSKLANISTRGLVQTGDNVLIAGTIVLGPVTQRVLVRAIGPSLSLEGKLENPTLDLRDGNGALIRSNDNWRSDQEAEIMATGIPPSNDLESAIVATLPANGAAYTAIVRGANDGTGVALVEVYGLTN
jgi:CSLREA domain-containing protein